MKIAYSAAVLAAFLFMSPRVLVAAPSIDIGFSPEGSAQQLVIQTLDDAHESIRLMGFTFTSPGIARALITAKRRGVDVRVVVDDRGNRSKASQAAMNLIVNADIPVRTNGQYKILHDKVIITDGRNVETGSFNYTRSAAESNSENALVIHDMPSLAQTYLAHWQSRWDAGRDWWPSY